MKTFPFIVVSGKESFNLVNVSNGVSQPLIKASGRCFYGQAAAFFTDPSDDEKASGLAAFVMNFAMKKYTVKNTRLSQWYQMTYREDFINRLTRRGRLPKQLSHLDVFTPEVEDFSPTHTCV